MQSLKTAIGLMSGTSMDGIDAALIRSDGENYVEVQAHMSFDYPPIFRRQLKKTLEWVQDIRTREERPENLATIEEELTSYHVQLVQRLLAMQKLQPRDIDLIGFHGQTILHRPDAGLTLQLGRGDMLAQQTGIDVIFDMRANDMAHGGQGAPLVPAYHCALATTLKDRLDFPCCFVNIGGIANLTYIEAVDEFCFDKMIALDCGPGNCLIDQWMEERSFLLYDAGGEAGLRGRIDEEIIASYMRHDHFFSPSPKSLDWRDFAPLHNAHLSLEDGAATLCALSARAILHCFRFLPRPPRTLIVSGGGAKNLCLMKMLAERAGQMGASLNKAEDYGLLSDFIEAEAWAYLAIRSSRSLPLSFPQTTGVEFPVTGGIFAPCEK